MGRDRPAWKFMISGVTLLCVALVAPAGAGGADRDDDWEQKPYFQIDGKIDFGTYNGFRRYGSTCFVCHGPDALGSSFAPGVGPTAVAFPWAGVWAVRGPTPRRRAP